jgi:hypothetical protein
VEGLAVGPGKGKVAELAPGSRQTPGREVNWGTGPFGSQLLFSFIPRKVVLILNNAFITQFIRGLELHS